MKLYGSTNHKSFNTLKLRAALAEAGADYEFVPLDLGKGEHKTAEFQRLNPHVKIPVLVDGDFVLPESDAILWYIGEKFPEAKLVPPPTAARAVRQARARVLQWCDFASTALYPAYADWWNAAIGPHETAPAEARRKGAGQDRARGGRDGDVLATREWIAIGGYSLADISNAAIIVTLSGGSRRPDRGPRTRARLVRPGHRPPAWQAALAELIAQLLVPEDEFVLGIGPEGVGGRRVGPDVHLALGGEELHHAQKAVAAGSP